MPSRHMAALLVLAALVAVIGGPRAAYAQDAPACRNDAAIVDRPDLAAPPILAPGAPFTVTWRLANTGDCTWDDGYALAPVDAAALGDPSASVVAPVAPGQTLTATITLTTPVAPGYHQAVWRLVDPAAVSFGPWLPLEIEVGGAPDNPDAAVGDVALPEVLAMSGFGLIASGAGEFYFQDPCLGTDKTAPVPVLENTYLQDRARRRGVHLCHVTPSTAVALTLTAPTGDLFYHSLVVPDPVPFTGDDGSVYTRNIATVWLGWLSDAAPGPWTLVASSRDGDLTVHMDLAPLSTPSARAPAPILEHRPVAEPDPFAAGTGCLYTYAPDQPFFITGRGFPPSTSIQLGLYESRFGAYYLAGRFRTVTDTRGSFRKLYTAAEPGQEYSIYLLDNLDPAAYSDDGLSYDPFLPFLEHTVQTVCYSVQPAARALSLAYTVGEPGAAEVALINADSLWASYASQGYGECDSGGPAWANDGALLFHSNCAGSYDLYRRPEPDTFGLTATPILTTPDADETDPSVAADGRIVFRRTPVGTDPESSGELWVLDPHTTDPVALGIRGHAPVWAPDGARIAYMNDTDGTWQVYLYDLASGETRLVSVDCPGHCRYPTWSPDGAALAYAATASVDDPSPAGLWLAALADGEPFLWQDGPYDQPAWSATGWILFTGPNGFYRARPDQPASAPIPYLVDSSALLRSPAWSD